MSSNLSSPLIIRLAFVNLPSLFPQLPTFAVSLALLAANTPTPKPPLAVVNVPAASSVIIAPAINEAAGTISALSDFKGSFQNLPTNSF